MTKNCLTRTSHHYYDG